MVWQDKDHGGTVKPVLSGHSKINKTKVSKTNGSLKGAQWLSGRVLDSRLKSHGFEPHRRHCVVVLKQRHIYPSLVLVQPRKTRPYITERLLMGHKESNQTNKNGSLMMVESIAECYPWSILQYF